MEQVATNNRRIALSFQASLVTTDKVQLDKTDQRIYGWILENNKLISETIDFRIVPKDLAEVISGNCNDI